MKKKVVSFESVNQRVKNEFAAVTDTPLQGLVGLRAAPGGRGRRHVVRGKQRAVPTSRRRRMASGGGG
jgi:hypothetical protein